MMSLPMTLLALASSAVLTAPVPGPASAGEPPRHLTLTAAVELALRYPVNLAQAEARLAEARERHAGAAGRLGPTLQAEGSLLRWSEPSELELVDADALAGAVPAAMQPLFAPLLAQIAEPISLRESTTSQLTLSIVQPLTPLYPLWQGYRATGFAEQAQQELLALARRDLTLQVTTVYYRLLQAEQAQQITGRALQTLAAHQAQVEAFVRGGFATEAQVLTVRAEQARMRAKQLRAGNARALAASALATLVGWEPGTPLTLDPLPEGEPPAPAGTVEQAEQRALVDRHELRALRQRVEIARAAGRAAWFKLVPTVAAVGRWQHTTGSALTPENELFVGGLLSWRLWDWGADWHEARAADEQLRQAEGALAEAEHKVRLELRQRWQSVEDARERRAAARDAVTLADEALRVTRLGFEQGTSGSTEVLDAETRQERARQQQASSTCELLVALAALRQALGGEQAPGAAR